MIDQGKHVTRAAELTSKLARVFQTRATYAREHFAQRTRKAFSDQLAELLTIPAAAWSSWTDSYNYAIDSAQRSILFWDALRRRGNQYLAHEAAGKPAVLQFEH
jgi:hypothetical protein